MKPWPQPDGPPFWVVSASLGQLAVKEINALFAFAGVTPDEIEAPCVSCLRPSHINGFVPRENLTKRSKSK